MFIFQDNLVNLSWQQNVTILDVIGAKDDRMDVAVTSGAMRCTKLQSINK